MSTNSSTKNRLGSFDLNGISPIGLDRAGNRADLAGPYGYDPVTGEFAVGVEDQFHAETRTTTVQDLWAAGWIMPGSLRDGETCDAEAPFIHRLTGTPYAPDGFDTHGRHAVTGTRQDPQGRKSGLARSSAADGLRNDEDLAAPYDTIPCRLCSVAEATHSSRAHQWVCDRCDPAAGF